MQIREISDVIRNSVSAFDVANALGLTVKHGRIQCPFHNGEGFNCKLYPENRGYYCFVCHKAGDSISLVTGVVPGCSYVDAMWWINDQFQLGFRQEHEKPSIYQRERAGKIRQRKMRDGVQNPG